MPKSAECTGTGGSLGNAESISCAVEAREGIASLALTRFVPDGSSPAAPAKKRRSVSRRDMRRAWTRERTAVGGRTMGLSSAFIMVSIQVGGTARATTVEPNSHDSPHDGCHPEGPEAIRQPGRDLPLSNMSAVSRNVYSPPYATVCARREGPYGA